MADNHSELSVWDLMLSNALSGSDSLSGLIEMQPCAQQVKVVVQLLFSCVSIRDSSLNIRALFAKADHDTQDHVVGESFASPQTESELRRTRDLCEHLVQCQAPYLLITARGVYLLAFWLKKLICFWQPPMYFTSLYLVPTLSQYDGRY